jgi:4-hydroxybenzoate polyprenyltransferase
MKKFKTFLNIILAMLFIIATIAGDNLGLDELSLLIIALSVTSGFRIFYKETYKYLTEYEPRESRHHHPDEFKKSAAKSSKSKLV